MTFAAGAGSAFQSVPEDPNIQTFVAKNATPGKALEFTISGTGSMPREAQADNGGRAGRSGRCPATSPAAASAQPINTPDPLSKYKWWILGGLALLLAAAAAFLLRKPAGAPSTVVTYEPNVTAAPAYAAPSSPAAKNTALLNALKEELFALESEKLSGTLSAEDYAQIKPALEIVLKRALKRNS